MMNVGVPDYYWRFGFAYWESLGGLLGVIFQIEGTSLKNWLNQLEPYLDAYIPPSMSNLTFWITFWRLATAKQNKGG